jgi:hypothetical protein
MEPNNENRTQSTYARTIFSKASEQWIQDIQPTPYKLTYDVEWQETGCLDNEWAYENKSENTTVTVEQTPFRHSLKARCY